MKQSEHSFLMQKQWKVQIALLSTEQKAQLLDAVYAYHCDKEDFTSNDPVMNIMWISMKQAFEYNEKKYKESCERNRENAKKRWEKQKDDASASECN